MNITFQPYHPSPVLTGHLRMGGENSQGERIEVNSRYLSRGGRPVIPVMGEYHFVRDSRDRWRRELAKVKAGGVTVVSTYLFWIYHEEIEGQFDFTGDRDVRAFVLACGEQGLDVVLRIGPWAHGECRNGGLPDWLQHSGRPLRTNDPGYMAKVRRWYEKIYAQVRDLFYKDNGPIIGIQFENELVNDAAHLLALKRLALEIGYDAPLYTVTGWNSRYGARIPVDEVLPVFAAYADAPWARTLGELPPSPHYAFDPNRNDSAVGMDILRDTDADGWRLPYERYPFATCELGCGMQPTHHRRPVLSGMDAYALSLVKLGCGNDLIGYYMYHGGTNKIGALSTLQESTATGYPNDLPILNYDFGACLSQYGEAREQYGLLNLLHLFATDFGEVLAPMEHVAAETFVPCTDRERLRCCLRTDGTSGFVFVNHHQRHMALADVHGAVLTALGVEFPAIDVCGSVSFFFPVRMALGAERLRLATAQPICREGNTWFFTAIGGIPARYVFDLPEGGERAVTVEPGLDSGFDLGSAHIVTLTFEQARYLRRLDGQIFVGEGCDLYALDGEVHAIQDGDFTYYRYADGAFRRVDVRRDFRPAALTLEPVEEPFPPPYAEELELGGPRKCRWYRLTVTTGEGFVEIPGDYDTAQIYAGQALIADHFYTGFPWRVPAELLYGRDCWLVMSERRDDFYLEPVGDL